MPPRFEYQIDRRYRVLRKRDMFPNPFRPAHKKPNERFWMANALFSDSLRVGLGNVAPHVVREPLAFPNEHLLVHVAGDLEFRCEGQAYRVAPHDLLFVPAFVDYQIVNVGDTTGRYFSGAARVKDWEGLPRADTPIAPEFAHHRFASARSLGRDLAHEQAAEFTDDWWVSTQVRASNTQAAIVTLGGDHRRPTTHSATERVIIGLDGSTTWCIDDRELEIGPEDLLFIPALYPFSYRASARDRARFLDCAATVEGLAFSH